MIAHAFVLAAILGVDAGSNAAGEPPSARRSSADPFAWLLGHWRGSGYLPEWLEHDERPWLHRRPTEPDTLGLTFTAGDGKISGVFDDVSPKGRRRIVAELVIELHDDYPLVWREEGRRYRAHLDLPAKDPGARRAALDRMLSDHLLRFSDMHGPTKGVGYPVIIELQSSNGRLSLRRYKGPQHGALASDDYGFERAP